MTAPCTKLQEERNPRNSAEFRYCTTNSRRLDAACAARRPLSLHYKRARRHATAGEVSSERGECLAGRAPDRRPSTVDRALEEIKTGRHRCGQSCCVKRPADRRRNLCRGDPADRAPAHPVRARIATTQATTTRRVSELGQGSIAKQACPGPSRILFQQHIHVAERRLGACRVSPRGPRPPATDVAAVDGVGVCRYSQVAPVVAGVSVNRSATVPALIGNSGSCRLLHRAAL